MGSNIFWTDEAIRNLEEILGYLHSRWSEKEVKRFKEKLSKQIELIAHFPQMFPLSEYSPRLRKAVLSKQTTIFYELTGNTIYLTYLFVNHQDSNKIK